MDHFVQVISSPLMAFAQLGTPFFSAATALSILSIALIVFCLEDMASEFPAPSWSRSSDRCVLLLHLPVKLSERAVG